MDQNIILNMNDHAFIVCAYNRTSAKIDEFLARNPFVGSSVSGGEAGARYGPSLMPGGNPEAWPHIKDIFQVRKLLSIITNDSIHGGGTVEVLMRLNDLNDNGYFAFFQSIAAKVGNEPCCDWVEEGGSGHFVKMFHNGIEYDGMQLICEAYHLMKDGLALGNKQMSSVSLAQ